MNNDHYSCENGLKEVQGATTSSHILPSLLQDQRPCIQLLLSPLTKTNLHRNNRVMIRHICSIKPEDLATVMSSELLAKLTLEDLDPILRERRLRWFGNVQRSSGAVRTARDIQIDGRRVIGRPKLT